MTGFAIRRIAACSAAVFAMVAAVMVFAPPVVGVASAQAECAGLVQEAEAGSVVGSSMVAAADGAASGGSFVWAAPGSYGRPFPNTDYVEFCVQVSEAGDYRIDADVLAESSADDSFYVVVDDTDVVLWDVTKSAGWITDTVQQRGSDDAAVWSLDAGDHTVRFHHREDGTKLDSFELVDTTQQNQSVALAGVERQVDEVGALVSVPVVLAEGEGVGFTAADLPPGVSVDAATGELSGIPTTAGVYEVTVTATNPLSVSDTTTFQWVVVDGAGARFGAIESVTGFETGTGVYVLGLQFTVDREMTVGELGVFDTDGNGRIDNPDDTPVGLWTDTGTLLGQTVVPAAAQAEADGFAYAPLADPIVLSPGATYRIALLTGDGESRAYDGTMVLADGITVLGGVYAFQFSLAFPVSTTFREFHVATFRTVGGASGLVIDPIQNQVSELDAAVSVATMASAAEGLILTYTADGLPAGMAISTATGVISGTPTSQETTTVTVSVTDELNNTASTSFEWTVRDSDALVVAAIADRSDSAFDAVLFTATTTSGNAAQWSASGLPEGVVIDTATGVISGNPRVEGTYDVTVTVTDDGNTTVSTSFEWQITEAARGFTLFRDVNQQGQVQVFPTGVWSSSAGNFSVVGNDTASSHLVTPGHLALVCTNASGSGTCRGFTNSKSDLGDFGLNDAISYVQVRLIGEPFVLAPGADVDQIVNALPAGTEFVLSPGVHSGHAIVPKLDQVFTCQAGAILDGNGVISPAFGASRGDAHNVVIKGCEIRNYEQGDYVGAINGRDTGNFAIEGLNWLVENNTIHSNQGPGVNLGSGMVVRNNEIYNNVQIGVSGIGSPAFELRDFVVDGNNIHDNNYGPVYATGNQYHEGGMKFTYSRDFEIINNDVHHNKGFGIHVDLAVHDGLIENNQVYNITDSRRWAGYIYIEEGSHRITARGNTVTTVDGPVSYVNDYMHGIVVAASYDNLIENNVILGGSQFGAHQMLGVNSYGRTESGNVFRNNRVEKRFGNGFVGIRFSISGAGNEFIDNTYIGSPGLNAMGRNVGWGAWQRDHGFDTNGSYS